MSKSNQPTVDKIREIKDAVAASLWAASEGISYKEAHKIWKAWLAELEVNPEHRGDCTREPQTCLYCLVEEYLEAVDQLLSKLEVVVLDEDQSLPLKVGESIDGERFLSAQEVMLLEDLYKEGWRKVVNPDGTKVEEG